MILAIHGNNTWFCSKCHLQHSILYFVKKGEAYCPACVTSEIKSKAVHVNQNRNRIEFKEEI